MIGFKSIHVTKMGHLAWMTDKHLLQRQFTVTDSNNISRHMRRYSEIYESNLTVQVNGIKWDYKDKSILQ